MQFRNLFMGIDPGLDGGVAIIRPGDTTPIYTERLKTFILHPNTFHELLVHFKYTKSVGGVHLCAMEGIPKGFPGSRGVNSSLTMGINWGLIKGMLVAQDYKVIYPLPQEWQKVVLGEKTKRKYKDPKHASIEGAKILCPGVNLLPGKVRNPHDGIADAVCLASYAHHKWKSQCQET